MDKSDEQLKKRSRIRWGIVGILVLLLITSFFDAPQVGNKAISWINNTTKIGIPEIPEKGFNLGLDLQGGAHLIYQADVSGIEDVERAAAVEGVRDVIERRVNGIGVGEPVIQTAKVGDAYRVIVELPGVTDVNEAINLIGETPILEFKTQNEEPPRELTVEEQKQIEEYNTDAKNRAQEVLEKSKTEDFEALVAEFSEDENTKNNAGYLGFSRKEFAVEENPVYDWAQQVAEGDISNEIIETPDGFNILKRGIERDGEEFIDASHILICHVGANGCSSDLYADREAAKQKAEELFSEANAENFAELASEFSTDPGASESNGELPSFPRGVMISAFEEAVFSAEVGDIIGPVETDFGFHIIYKKDQQQTKEYEVSRILVKTQSELDILPPSDPWKSTGLSGKQLERASVASDYNTGEIQVSLQFDGEGKELFKQITEENIGKQVAIFLDGQIITDPVVNTVIPDGQAVITGGFNLAQAQLIAQRLNAGALPVPVDLISQQTIGASLGAESLQKSLYAASVALVLVMIFMLLYYRLPGLLSILALSLYLSLTLAIFKLIGVTLTLAGIAGLILSIGMAVDANVLIFERLKEELKKGKSLKTAVEEGFVRAWSAIRDGNISTIITCFLLIWFGSSFVQGFAFTLMIGVLISMFSAITVTRVLLRFVAPWFPRHGNKLFLGYKKQSQEVSE